MKIYLAGPMRGIPQFNFPAFHEGAAKLRADGHVVFNPAERDVAIHGPAFAENNLTGDNSQAEREHGFNLRDALRDDLVWICAEADAVVCLPGWENSKGVAAERATALALGLPIFDLLDFQWAGGGSP